MAENIIELKGVNLAYNKDYCALYDINLELKKGDRICIYGDTGSGKTALIRLIAGLEKAKEGECLLKGTPVNKVNFARDVSLGYLSTKAVFFERKSVYKNLMWALKVHKVDKAERKERIENVLREYGIEGLRDEKVKNLCSSDRRLVQIARMSMRPLEIVLCDDVLAEYDDMDTKARIRKALLKLFDSAPKDKVIIMTSTDRKSCEGFVNKFIEIKSGSLVDKEKGKETAKIDEKVEVKFETIEKDAENIVKEKTNSQSKAKQQSKSEKSKIQKATVEQEIVDNKNDKENAKNDEVKKQESEKAENKEKELEKSTQVNAEQNSKKKDSKN